MEEMDFNSYQRRASYTAIYPTDGLNGLLYTSLGLVSEAGEVAGKVKKILRDNNSIMTDERKEHLIDELGDVLWYCAMIANELKTNLGAVATRNVNKLEDRKNRNVIGGSGDNR
jgi:NTP pyrophosphatase (non-canonical NTP hydrolase)